MMKYFVAIASALIFAADVTGQNTPSAEFQAVEVVRQEGLTVVHLWAPWCSNCQTELKGGGWTKIVKDNPNVRFVFVSVWNGGDAAAAMLKKNEIGEQPNVTIIADAGPRTGPDRLKRFLDLPVTWIPATWVYKTGELRYALNYGEVRFPMLRQFLEDSNSEWSHKGETAQN